MQVRCVCAGVGGLDISIYSGGIICGDLVSRLSLVLDYARKRIGVSRERLEQLVASGGVIQAK